MSADERGTGSTDERGDTAPPHPHTDESGSERSANRRRSVTKRHGIRALSPDEASCLVSVRVISSGHIKCDVCGFTRTWSGGWRPGSDPRFGSESVGTYMLKAQHDCSRTP